MQQRTTAKQKVEIVKQYLSGENATNIAPNYGITNTAILGLLHRRNIKIRSQSQIQRKYSIDETFFDNIDTQEKAYFLGFLYADGYNNTNHNAVNLSLKEADKEILIKLNNLLQPAKPLQFVNMESQRKQGIKASNQYRLVIANKHISNRLNELGCVQAKTYILEFPEWLNINLYPHFIRGYNDGDGYIGKRNISITSTDMFCNKLKYIFKNILNITSSIRIRHPGHNNNICMLEISGGRQCKKLLDWLYKDATIYLQRKYDSYISLLDKIKEIDSPRLCSIERCNEKHHGNGYCRKHYYQFCNGKEKRHIRYITTGK
mgnify:CR=1 FL=1